MTAPLVTVIITSYNRPRLCADAIASIREQDYEHIELLIADDDSNDETVRAIRAAVGTDPRCIVMEQVLGRVQSMAERQGRLRYSAGINKAIPIAKGQYFCYLPDDDYLMPGCIAARVRVAEETCEHVVYTKQRSITYDEQKFWDSSAAPRAGRSMAHEGEIDPETDIDTDIASWWPGYRSPIVGIDHGMLMHRRDCLDEIGGGPQWWPEDIKLSPGDAAFFARLDRIGHKAWAIDFVGHTKRFHGLSIGRVPMSERRE